MRATGLNFRDVLNVLGPLRGRRAVGRAASAPASSPPSEPASSGSGPATESWPSADTAFATTCVAPQEVVRVQPAGLTDAEAATIPIAFLTAHYALSHLGGMRAGERVLIHAAAGGVGMAAVQLALRAGAEVFATAGSDAKRAVLRAMGVRHVYDSRTLDFGAEILRRHRRRGRRRSC